jgi:hypothetical protein
MSWPGGVGTQLRIQGRCRDLHTPAGGPPATVAEAEVDVGAGTDRNIDDIATVPPLPEVAGLIGVRAGDKLRSALAESVPEQRERGTPLYLLLDDLAGATLVAGFAWFRWMDVLPEIAERRKRRPIRTMQGICAGFRPGSSALNPDGTQSWVPHNVAPVPPLVDPADPEGWHELDPPPQVAMRRARRIDVRPTDDTLEIDAMFRDSTGNRMAPRSPCTSTTSRRRQTVRRMPSRPSLPNLACSPTPNVRWPRRTPPGWSACRWVSYAPRFSNVCDRRTVAPT